MKNTYTSLTYQDSDTLIYGHAARPVILKNGLSIGGGQLYPEINFTLPPMSIDQSSMSDVIKNYRQMVTDICERAKELFSPGFVIEVETLPPMTFEPKWGEEVCKVVVDISKEFEAKEGIKTGVRLTPVDPREGRDLTHMWHGKHWDLLMETFERCAEAGADMLAVESVGGKEIHDDAIMYCDIAKSVLSLSLLACTDMNHLWKAIVDICKRTNTIPSGDSACGFANTAMVLAERNYIPKVFAAAVRAMTAVRTLVCVEQGAVGPLKDCAYESVYIKAITGVPVSLEGRSAACAHLSPIGNISICMADLWSNESTSNIRLLSGMAPTVCFEELTYDCRLMNAATARGPKTALLLRDLHAESDSMLDPQAYILRPDVVLEIAEAIVKADSYYDRVKAAAAATFDALRKGHAKGELILDDKENGWIDSLSNDLDGLPQTAEELLVELAGDCEKLDPSMYDMDSKAAVSA